MAQVYSFPTRKHIRNYDECSGCHTIYDEAEEYTEIVLPFDDCDKHILLCDSCCKEAEKTGIF